MIALTVISSIFGIIQGIDTILKFPDTIKKVNNYIENWDEVSAEIRKLISHIKTKFKIISYSIHVALYTALEELKKDRYDVQKAVLVCANEFSCRTG